MIYNPQYILFEMTNYMKIQNKKNKNIYLKNINLLTVIFLFLALVITHSGIFNKLSFIIEYLSNTDYKVRRLPLQAHTRVTLEQISSLKCVFDDCTRRE